MNPKTKCLDCPIVTHLNVRVALYEAIREDVTNQAVQQMQRLDAAGESPEAVRQLGAEVKRADESIDEDIAYHRGLSELLQSACPGPAIRRRYRLFGERVLMCTSRQASLSWKLGNTTPFK